MVFSGASFAPPRWAKTNGRSDSKTGAGTSPDYCANLRRVRAVVDTLIALVAALLPKRRWDDWDLPIANVVFTSSLLTCLGGAALGITGFFTHMSAILAAREFTAPPFMMPAYFGYVFFTPRGLFSLYLTISGLLRALGWFIDEAFGDPILTGVDTLLHRGATARRAANEHQARERMERADEPDRLHDGEWAGVPDATYVVVAARRKTGWTKGTWVITTDGWYTLGEPFDRPTPNGLRTIYPLTLQTTTLEVLRKGVSYELPPLRPSAPRKRSETLPTPGES